MKLKIKHLSKKGIPSIENISLIYIIGASLSQVIETCLGGGLHISWIFMLSLIVSLVINAIDRLGKKILLTMIVLLFVGLFYLGIFKMYYDSYFGWMLAAIISIWLTPLMHKYISFSNFNNWNIFENLFLILLVVNIVLYSLGNHQWFSYDFISWRYKGGSNNPNQFAIISFSILLIELYRNTKRAWFNKIAALFLILATGSRLYLINSILVIALHILYRYKGRKKYIYILFGVCITTAFFIFGNKIDTIIRLAETGFGSNGRTYLYLSAINTFLNGSILGILSGVGLINPYLHLTILTPTHSFAESSFFSMLMLFGILGLILTIIYIILLYKKCNTKLYKYLLPLMLMPMLLNDIVLYPQGFVCLNIGIIVIAANTRNMNAKQCYYISSSKKDCK